MKYYCYVYYDENWSAYYVGKGVGIRAYRSQGHPVVPPKERIQRFDFDQEWQSWECEIELIAFWGRQCDGGTLVNRSVGGRGGHTGVTVTDETKQKISAALKGKKRSAETRAKMSAAQKGNRNCKGRKLSAESRAKMSNNRKGKKHSAETRAKMSNTRKGRKLSAETKSKISAAKKEYYRRIREERE